MMSEFSAPSPDFGAQMDYRESKFEFTPDVRQFFLD